MTIFGANPFLFLGMILTFIAAYFIINKKDWS